MTAGRRARRSLPALGLALLCGLAMAAAPPLAAALLARLAKAPPASTPFIQVSFREVLDQPLIVSGTLKWLGGKHLVREVTKPYKSIAEANAGELSVRRNGSVHRIPLARAPQVGAMLAGFRALLGGNVAALEKNFSLAATGDPSQWQITLTPRNPQLKSSIDTIVIDGRGGDARCLIVHDAGGDTSITLVGAMARAHALRVVPRETELAARCRGSQ